MHVTAVPTSTAATECVNMAALPKPQADQQVSHKFSCLVHDACTLSELLWYASTTLTTYSFSQHSSKAGMASARYAAKWK